MNLLYTRLHTLHKYQSASLMFHIKAFIRLSFIILSAVSVLMKTGCSVPHIQPADNQVLQESTLLAFIRDGVTTEEEVLTKLGFPHSQLERDRILMYRLLKDEKEGEWRVDWELFFIEKSSICSLVLVFGSDGVLRKHSLVMAK